MAMNVLNRAFKSALPQISQGLNSINARCSSPRCKPRGRFLPFAFRSEGIQVGSAWYCSPECFEEAALMRFAQLYTNRNNHTVTRKPRMPLGLSSLSLGYITPEQLQCALQAQQEQGGRIGDVMVGLGYLTQSQVTAALASQWGYPVLSLQNHDSGSLKRIPMRLVEKYSMLPVHFIASTNKLVIGFSQMVEHRILSTIEEMFDCAVIPCFITPEDYEARLHTLQAADFSSESEVVFEQRATLQEIARTTRSYAAQIGALSARFGLCSDYLWSRLEAPHGAVDILSKI